MKFEAEHAGRTVPVEVAEAGGRFTVTIDGEAIAVDARQTSEGVWSILLGGASHVANVTEEDGV